jgi:hypothetical protein
MVSIMDIIKDTYRNEAIKMGIKPEYLPPPIKVIFAVILVMCGWYFMIKTIYNLALYFEKAGDIENVSDINEGDISQEEETKEEVYIPNVTYGKYPMLPKSDESDTESEYEPLSEISDYESVD